MGNFINNTKQPFTVITNDLLQEKTIFKNANQKLCYLYLYSLKNCSSIFPSHETISKAVCCSISTVKRTLQDLGQLNLLDIKSRPGFTSIYILNDYHDVAQNNLGQNELAQNESGAQVKLNYEVDQNEPLKLKDKNKIIKNKNSSREEINIKLKELYPTIFEEVIKQVLEDGTLIINTDKQYYSVLLYRLKNYIPQKKSNFFNKKSIRKEIVPEWLQDDFIENESNISEEEVIKMRQQLMAQGIGVNCEY
ncbi:helix-turn-helix domain-containing protein [Gottfriedia sp. NPDC057948]|uniref:helix-turn-helix domain-containing protein n=1 Tax=Gottfriedia sp. NPDC057948 TaxID=3346287 RepID=UPI0036DB6F69